MIEHMPPGAAAPMPRRLWWMIVLRGLAAVVFGLVAIFWPGVSLALLIALFGAYALVDGTLTLVLALRLPRHVPRRGLLVFTGATGLVVGLISVLWPQVTVALLIYVFAGWLVLFGLIAIAHSLSLKRQYDDWPVSKVGILLLIVGLLLALFPGAVAVVATWVIGILALLLGAGLLAFAWRRHQRDSMVL